MSAQRPDFAALLVDEFAARVAERISAASSAPPLWRTLAAEGARRGFPSPRAFRDWCRENGVPLRGRGKHQVVTLAEVDAALARLPQSAPIQSDAAQDNDPMEAALAAAGVVRVVPARRSGAR